MNTIDLRSDTVTRPGPELRRAMAEAEVGDDFYRDDPTVAKLEETAAGILGKPAAMLVISGTMGNLLSLLVSTRRGDSILVADNSHIFLNESGNFAAIAGLMPIVVSHPYGLHCADQVTAAIRPPSVLTSPLSLVALENTHNAGGGRPLGPKETQEIIVRAHASNLKVHLDGARIFNAAVALGVSVATLAEGVDSVTFCFSKGLGCPLGSIVAGSEDFIAAARHWRQKIGGGMRQAGIFAAAGLFALDRMVDRLAEDHANARKLAGILRECGFDIAFEVTTNMVFVDIPTDICPVALVRGMQSAGVIVNPAKGRRLRFVTHVDISAADIEESGRRIRSVLGSARHVLRSVGTE